MVDGKLVAPYKTCVLLASYAVQSELGDYNPEEHYSTNYLNEFRFVPDQTPEMLLDIAALHRKHRGLSPAACEMLYIDVARRLSSYGIHLLKATWDQTNEEIQLGVTCTGLAVFQKNKKIYSFNWSQIVKISFKRKQFYVHLRKDQEENIDNLFGFNMSSYRACKNLWRSCVEHHTFFSQLQQQQRQQLKQQQQQELAADALAGASTAAAAAATGFSVVNNEGAVGVGSSHFSQRSLSDRPVNRPATHPVISDPSMDLHNRSLDTALVSQQRRVGNNMTTPFVACQRPDCTKNCDGLHGGKLSDCLSYVDGLEEGVGDADRMLMSVEDIGVTMHESNGPTARPHSYAACSAVMPNGGVQYRNLSRSAGVDFRHSFQSSLSGRASGLTPSKSSGQGSRIVAAIAETRRSNVSEPSSDDEGCNSRSDSTKVLQPTTGGSTVKQTSSPPSLTTSIGSFGERSPTEQYYDLPSYTEPTPVNGGGSAAGYESHGLVTIHMKPDARGTFGFNVKGGCDQMMPIIVSRVAPGSPADLCAPRLTEGYQVLFINGRDVSQHTHAQVVQFIRASRETHSGELILVVRPNASVMEDSGRSEPDYQYTHDMLQSDLQQLSLDSNTDNSSLAYKQQLADSMSKLQQSIDSGAAVTQFDQVYRKKTGMTMNAAVHPDNIAKNRYRDILPYDQTRVKLKGTTHDYINANFVKMLISSSGVVNRYIAAQGPLPETSADFWLMIWEQRSTLVVMLTMTVERGRVKCHQYWPEYNKAVRHGDLTVRCVREEKRASFEYRDFIITQSSASSSLSSKNRNSIDDGKKVNGGGGGMKEGEELGKDEEHHVHQMQYLSWPDHGVPDDSSDFLDFVTRVRQNRAGVVEPIVVHCSAGIGRTGVLISMETAMCMIEANQPVELLEVVRKMREQRAMLIQTSEQYKFVCGAVVKVYDERIVEPVEDLKR